MSKETKPRKPRSSTKKSKSELEAKIAELEAKLNQLSSQVRPGEARAPPPAPKPKEAPRPSTSSGEVAPAYANVSSTTYTGNKYYATRARLAYHPPDKQFKGESTVTTQTSRPSPPPELKYTYEEPASRSQERPKSSTWKAKGAQAAEEYHVEGARPESKEESRPTTSPAPKPKEVPKPTVAEKVQKVSSTEKAAGEVAPAYATISSTGYTGNRYYATRARLSYHPPDKQYKGEAQSATVQVAEPPKPKAKRGTLPAGWKP